MGMEFWLGVWAGISSCVVVLMLIAFVVNVRKGE